MYKESEKTYKEYCNKPGDLVRKWNFLIGGGHYVYLCREKSVCLSGEAYLRNGEPFIRTYPYGRLKEVSLYEICLVDQMQYKRHKIIDKKEIADSIDNQSKNLVHMMVEEERRPEVKKEPYYGYGNKTFKVEHEYWSVAEEIIGD